MDRNRPERKRKPRTSTSSFGVSRRESHDSTDFYSRFTLPTISDDDNIQQNDPRILNEIYECDARRMPHLKDNSVALVVTSPPYFVGKDYEQALGGEVPESYFEYLELLYEVFSECKRVLEPGGRIAVNAANLGRKPYRSLSSDIIDILQRKLGLLMRGEIIWIKGQASSGSCAWGSYGSPANPVLRDLTERIIVASKGRFDRAISRGERAKRNIPSRISIRKDDFLEFTQDTWDFPPESAHKVNHPAPFPVELPHRLIELYTYEDDVVLDPFIGSGSTAVAALRSKRPYVGYDLDNEYVGRARNRLAAEKKRIDKEKARSENVHPVLTRPALQGSLDPVAFQARAVEEGRRAKQIARELLEGLGFEDIVEDYRLHNGVEVNYIATDHKGNLWLFDVTGAFTSNRPGLRRTDTLWKALGKAAVLRAIKRTPLVLLTTDLPDPGSVGYLALQSTRGILYHDAIEMFSLQGQQRLRLYARGRNRTKPHGELLRPAP